jgi:hypothetical protein
MKRKWVVSSVTYPGSEVIKVEFFSTYRFKMFEGSTWNFISNNNKGNMALTANNCPSFSSPITWFVRRSVHFESAGRRRKAKKVRDGYILNVYKSRTAFN